MNKKLMVALSGLLSASAFAGVTDPSSVKITVYAVAVSASDQCTDPILVSQYPDGKEFDFAAAVSPSIFQGALAPGTYPCVMMQMSDVLKFTPKTTTGNCTAGTEYTSDVCRASGCALSAGTPGNGTVHFDAPSSGTGTTGTPANDKPWLFLSTSSTTVTGGNSGSAFVTPSKGVANGFKLGSALVVSGDSAKSFVVDFRQQIDGSQNPCDCGPPVFSFK